MAEKKATEAKPQTSSEFGTHAATDLEEAAAVTQEAETQESGQPALVAPTSNNVGKQTMTKADLGYDVREREGFPVPPETGETLVSPRHPDDPSGHEGEETP